MQKLNRTLLDATIFSIPMGVVPQNSVLLRIIITP